MDKLYKDLIDKVDDLMVALCKQKALGLDASVIQSLKAITKSRNEFKKAFIKAQPPVPAVIVRLPLKLRKPPKPVKPDYGPFLDMVADFVEKPRVG